MLMTEPETHHLTALALRDLPMDATVVCATQRLAQTLRQVHDQHQATGSAWHTLKSTTTGEWLNQLHGALALRGTLPPGLAGLRLLNSFQEQLIWEKVIQAQMDDSVEALFDLQSLTTNAAQAHRLSIEWNIPVAGDQQASEEQRQFHHWQIAFRAHCEHHALIDPATMHARLIDHLPLIDNVLIPAHISFAGFDHFTALEQRLHKQLQARGAQLSLLDEDAPAGHLTRFAPSDLAQECLAIGAWAQQHLAQNPQARLGIVAPDLESYQRPLQDALEDTLNPEHIFAHNAQLPRLFNISLGQPLANMPMVNCALTMLHIIGARSDIEQSTIASLLHNPYWSLANGIAEADARARLDAGFRSSVALKAPLSRYEHFATWFLNEHKLLAPSLRQHLHELVKASNDKQNTRLPSEWHRHIERLLIKTGWLAEGKLNSLEFQTKQAFDEALNELSRLDLITGKLSFNEALRRLNQRCSEQLFQPKTTGKPPIQILGVLESTGLRFDALWICGLTETSWAPPAHPNPLLSIAAQRQQHAPNSCANVQLDFAQRIQQRLLRSAPDITISAPRMDGDTELQASALITGYPLSDLPKPPGLSWISDIGTSPHTHLEAVADAIAPPVEAGAHVRGGTWLLRAQAICPAWGFYQYRLGAVPLQDPSEGLDARQRGTLVHDVLEAFWKSTQDLARLQALMTNGLDNAIAQAIDLVMEAYNTDKRHEPLKPRQQSLERKRLHRLIYRWLTMEAARIEPFTVIQCEQEFKDNIGGIEVRMFIDRIDQLSDGKLLIIDYKTGANIDTRNWASDRLTEPQLPIYAAIAKPTTGEVAGVAFGQVHLSKLAFKGIGDAENLVPGVEDLRSYRVRRVFGAEDFPDWNSVLDHWHTAIHKIAAEVCSGDASVRYANENDLMYCDVLPILRLAERQQQLEADENRTEPETRP